MIEYIFYSENLDTLFDVFKTVSKRELTKQETLEISTQKCIILNFRNINDLNSFLNS